MSRNPKKSWFLFGDLGEPHHKKNTVAHLQLGMVYGIGFTTLIPLPESYISLP